MTSPDPDGIYNEIAAAGIRVTRVQGKAIKAEALAFILAAAKEELQVLDNEMSAQVTEFGRTGKNLNELGAATARFVGGKQIFEAVQRAVNRAK